MIRILQSPGNSQNIRVMHMVNILALAGMEYGVIKLTNRLDRSRFRPMICCLQSQAGISRRFLDDSISVFELHKREGRDLALIPRLARLFREQKIDVVHSHNWQTYFHSVMAAKLAGVPVLIHGEHGRETREPSRRRLILKRMLARLVTQFTTVSQDLANELRTQWGVGRQRIHAIENGVDLDLFGSVLDESVLRRELDLDPACRVLTIVGGLRKVKDHPTLIKAFALVRQQVPTARLLIVGSEFEEGMRKGLERIAEESGVAADVRFTGPRQDVPALLGLSDIYVNSSIFEGMSNTILEAMASRLPVVATAVGGNPELVRDGETGYLVPPGEPGEMARSLLALLNDSGLAESMGAKARRIVETDHSMANMVRRYSDLYEETYTRYRLGAHVGFKEMSKKAVARIAVITAVPGLKSRIAPGRLAILTYHRVLPITEACRYPFRAMVVTTDHFEAHMAHLADGYNVLPLDEAVERLKHADLPPRAVTITFDDGYRDNLDHAVPIMRKYGVPGTIFVVADPIYLGTNLWWDELSAIIQCITDGENPTILDNEKFPEWIRAMMRDPGRIPEYLDVIEKLIARLNGTPRRERLAILERFRKLGALMNCPDDRIMFSEDQLIEVHRSGIMIGSHTMSHAFLNELEDEQVRQEIERSVELLSGSIGSPVRYFAYPRGRANRRVESILQEHGIEAAFTTSAHVNNKNTNLYGLGRIDTGYFRMMGEFDPAVLDLELQGVFFPWRRGDS